MLGRRNSRSARTFFSLRSGSSPSSRRSAPRFALVALTLLNTSLPSLPCLSSNNPKILAPNVYHHPWAPTKLLNATLVGDAFNADLTLGEYGAGMGNVVNPLHRDISA